MKLHYMGKYNLNPESLPHGEHMPSAVPFREAKDSKQLAVIANIGAVLIMILLAIPAAIRYRAFYGGFSLEDFPDLFLGLFVGAVISLVTVFPHELLHAVCFKEDVYLYTNLRQGLVFVIGTETMSKFRFVFMSALPNVVFGVVPYILGMIFPNLVWLLSFGILAVGMGAGDYYNIFNALTQMPKGARTYLYQFNSYWYIP